MSLKKSLHFLSGVCLLALPTLFVGCTSLSSSSKTEQHQMELSLHKVRTELEDIKHNLNSYEVEHNVLEGKLIAQEQVLAALKKEFSEQNLAKLESIVEENLNLEKKLQQLSKKQEKIINDIRQLSTHANDTTTALSQYKERIAQFEKTLQMQNEVLQSASKLKEEQVALTSPKGKKYVVRSGDSLEKIARDHRLTVEQLKHHNNLSNDMIVVDQELQIP